jgi:predicted alpha/beta hydrolase family esterase
MNPRILHLPGWTNSGPQHWQTIWEVADKSIIRVEQRDWDYPVREEWVSALDAAVVQYGPEIVLVCHSLGCALAAHWVKDCPGRTIRGALLVAPSDPERPGFSPQITGFAPMPMDRLPFQSIVLASSDDVSVSLGRAAAFAASWGSRFVNVGPLGHINSVSNLGEWPQGRSFLTELIGAG